MALFGTKKNTEKPAKKAAAPVSAGVSQGARNLAHVLRHARITEKATMNQAAGVYTFDIESAATKRDIMQAVKALYGVTPRKVAIVNVPSKIKQSMRTGMRGVKRGG